MSIKRFFVILFLCGLLVAGGTFLWAESGRESKYLPPQEVEIMYPSEDHAYQVKDISDVIRWKVLPDGTMATYDKTGNTTWGVNSDTGSGVTGAAVAVLSGSTGTVSWGASSTGASGWHLSTAILQKYDAFLIETQHPGGLISGASSYSDVCPSGVSKLETATFGGTGETIYITGALSATIHGRSWTFTNRLGTTPFVLYDGDSLIRTGAGAGTTESPVTTTNRGCEDVGDSVTIKAVYYPVATGGTSGWYVTNIWNYD